MKYRILAINFKCDIILHVFRSHDDSYARGILSDDQYQDGKRKSLISLKMCFLGWLYEFIAIFFVIFSTHLRDNFPFLQNLHIPDAVVSFVLIPFLHLMNDEETKMIIFEENWFAGVKYIFGFDERTRVDVMNKNT